MSAELPTEEDVLAALLVQWAIAEVDECPLSAWLTVPQPLRSLTACGWGVTDIERAIADSERRLEVEQAERAVLEAAETWWSGAISGFRFGSVVDRYRAARGRLEVRP